MAVVVVAQLAGLIAMVIVLPLLPPGAPQARDLFWGAAAGVTVGIGIPLLYRALAVGRMAVVAPTTAVCAVLIPVTTAMVLGERPRSTTLAGIGLALVSIVLAGRHDHRADPPVSVTTGPGAGSGFWLALAAGVGIGLFYLTLARAAPTAGLWPVLVARSSSVLLLGGAAIVRRQSLRMALPVAAMVVAAGVIDMISNALYLIATHHGSLSVVVTLSSLYPASTVVLALVVLGERLGVLQVVGIVCALVAVLLIVAR